MLIEYTEESTLLPESTSSWRSLHQESLLQGNPSAVDSEKVSLFGIPFRKPFLRKFLIKIPKRYKSFRGEHVLEPTVFLDRKVSTSPRSRKCRSPDILGPTPRPNEFCAYRTTPLVNKNGFPFKRTIVHRLNGLFWGKHYFFTRGVVRSSLPQFVGNRSFLNGSIKFMGTVVTEGILSKTTVWQPLKG